MEHVSNADIHNYHIDSRHDSMIRNYKRIGDNTRNLLKNNQVLKEALKYNNHERIQNKMLEHNERSDLTFSSNH